MTSRTGVTSTRPALTKPRWRREMADKGICTITGCIKPVSKCDMCNAHYLKNYRHGDPLRKLRADNGEPEAWLRRNVGHSGEGCLKWPFAKGRDGRGRIGSELSPQAHRAMCVLVNGPPPSAMHEAAHSCGKGHEGCVHPAHIRWATPVENAADRNLHGTETRGEQVPGSKLKEHEVRLIRIMKGRSTQAEIGRLYGVDGETIGNIYRRETWAWLE